VDNQVRLHLFVLAYNLGNFLRQAVLPQAVRHWTLTTLREKLIKIGVKVVRHSGRSSSRWRKWRSRESCSGPFWNGLGGCEWQPRCQDESWPCQNHDNQGGGVFTSGRKRQWIKKWRRNICCAEEKPRSDWKNDLQICGTGRK